MTVVRGTRTIALILAFALTLLGSLLSATTPAAAATPQTVVGHIEDSSGTGLADVEVIVADYVGTFYTGLTDSNGDFAVNLPDEDWYTIAAGSDTWIWQYTDPEIYVDGSEGSIDFVLEPGIAISGVVTDIADDSFLADVFVFAIPLNDPSPPLTPGSYPIPVGYIDFHLPTSATDGAYSITVPPNDDYFLIAFDIDFEYDPQFYNGLNFSSSCLCDPEFVSILSAPAAGKDFHLYRYSDWVYVSVNAARDPGPDDFDGLLVTLQRKNSGTGLWDDAASGITDASGVVDLYGRGAGEYRIIYAESGVRLTATSAEDHYTGSPLPLSEGGTVLELGTLTPLSSGGCGCGGPGAFTERIIDMLFPEATSGGGSGGGGGSAVTPRQPRTTVSSWFGGGGTIPTPTSTPTPSATPTSTPSPSPTQSGDPEPTASPTPTPDPVPASDAGFPWWIILIIVLAVGIVITVIVLIRRR